MYSRMAGTGWSSEPSGRQIRAASSVPSRTGMVTSCSSLISWGSEVTTRIGSGLPFLDLEPQPGHALLVLVLKLLLVVRPGDERGQQVAVAVLGRQLGQPGTVPRSPVHAHAVELPLQRGDLVVRGAA